MRTYKYQFILENLELKNWFVYYAYGTNKQDAIKHIDLMFPCKIVSGMRVNKTDRKKNDLIKPHKNFSKTCSKYRLTD